MKHVSLDTQDDSVQRFVLSLAIDPEGSVLELSGRPLAWMLPVPAEDPNGGTADPIWTEAQNARRCALIDKEIAGTLRIEEAAELQQLQRAMLRYRRRVAPLPLEEARQLQRELRVRAQRAADAS